MPSTGDLQYPSSVFTTVRQAFQVLESAEVNPEKFLQALRDKPEFRKLVVDAYSREFPTVLYGIPRKPKNLERFVYFATGLRHRDLEAERKQFAKYSYKYTEEALSEYTGDNLAFENYIELMKDHNVFESMFDGLDELSISLVVSRLGLETGKGMTQKVTANLHSTTVNRCNTLISRARDVVEGNMQKLTNISDPGGTQ